MPRRIPLDLHDPHFLRAEAARLRRQGELMNCAVEAMATEMEQQAARIEAAARLS